MKTSGGFQVFLNQVHTVVSQVGKRSLTYTFLLFPHCKHVSVLSEHRTRKGRKPELEVTFSDIYGVELIGFQLSPFNTLLLKLSRTS